MEAYFLFHSSTATAIMTSSTKHSAITTNTTGTAMAAANTPGLMPVSAEIKEERM